ncbi:MAG: thioredoxin fold domain-containing protein [Sulfuricurvum sp.]|uniref:thioredoxin family protein n=1 Tax=Sulfuricurvum sp. TaxID=2025608 RepID=UPI002624904D|nr:thioredoxin fold domain-containing protein [Sulfuricurvum sp.]MDD2829382.1 thioredoxin fold domain-containing protein [Sulfuricurvum sp.]MDD4949127.1 thioredoxin fold domain-containing protein [Sulfuricurvum sp.]
MKYMVLMWMFVWSLWGGTIHNDEQFKGALGEMGKENKIVLMIYSTDDCPECAYMKKKVFHDTTVETYLSQNFVVIEKNIHKSKLPDGFDYFGIPTMFFIDKAGNKKETIVGSKRPQLFLSELKRIRGMK